MTCKEAKRLAIWLAARFPGILWETVCGPGGWSIVGVREEEVFGSMCEGTILSWLLTGGRDDGTDERYAG